MKILASLLIVTLCLVSFTEQCCQESPSTKVVRQNKASYTLAAGNIWREYPQLKITLQLADSQYVSVSYLFSIICSPDSHIVSRLIVDNVQDQNFRAITGNTTYHTNSANFFVFLSAGKHEIRVEYRTPGTCSAGVTDWNIATLQVAY